MLFISDEVMTGVGRTGRNFGVEHWDAVPDLMLVAKGLSGGYTSLAAVVAHDRVIEVLRSGGGRYEHNFTYAGNPVACAVGSAVLNAIEAESVVDHVADVEAEFFALLGGLRRHSIVGDVRGRGLMAGIELVMPGGREPFPASEGVARRVDLAARKQGLLVYPCSGIVDGRVGDAILLLPPLTIDRHELAQLAERLDAALGAVSEAVVREVAGA